jgi:hypothetical protein
MFKISETLKVLSKEDINKFKKNGYIIIRSLFSKEEVDNLVSACQKKNIGDTLGIADFNSISLSKKIIDNIRPLLGKNIVYPCLSLSRADDKPINPKVQIKSEANGRFFHVDSKPDDFNFSVDYGIINTGIYLSDHKNASGGIKLIPGSHKYRVSKKNQFKYTFIHAFVFLKRLEIFNFFCCLFFGYSVNLDTLPGDFVIWNTRCHHSGHFRRLKLLNSISIYPFLENILPDFFFLKEPKSREVILTIYASKESPYINNYIENQIKKERRKNHYLNNENIEKIKKNIASDITIRNDGYFYWKHNLNNKNF